MSTKFVRMSEIREAAKDADETVDTSLLEAEISDEELEAMMDACERMSNIVRSIHQQAADHKFNGR